MCERKVLLLSLSLKRIKGYMICVINTLGSNAVNYTLSNKMWLVLNSVQYSFLLNPDSSTKLWKMKEEYLIALLEKAIDQGSKASRY